MADPKPPLHHQRAATDSELLSSSPADSRVGVTFPDASPPSVVKHGSIPSFSSPLRHHYREPSKSRSVKETLDARSHYGSYDDEDGSSIHHINQYSIEQEIGRGSFGAVHLAKDQYGKEFVKLPDGITLSMRAVKEFSKSRLRKRAQSNLLRRPNAMRRPGHSPAGVGFNSPLHRHPSEDRPGQGGGNNSLSLIKEEIAIMKKLNHNNVVSLYEVLDDPEEDSLYMILEMCKKGVVMKVGIDEQAEPYGDEPCRCWFRDLILGIEYLHAQGIIHRDIKPDNCLITDDDVLKIVDFGVSEMFEKKSDMATAKSAGSPAFMPPELCVARHGAVSGRAADIWSMGVTLYCLRYGRIPFEKTGMLELYESIRNDEAPLHDEPDAHFKDLIQRLLCKDPDKRIDMAGIREHPWVTKNGGDPLLSTEENCADIVEPPTEAEMNHAITGNPARVLVVMKAVNKFKELLRRNRPQFMDSLLGRDSQIVAPPLPIAPKSQLSISRASQRDDGNRTNTEHGKTAGADIEQEITTPHALINRQGTINSSDTEISQSISQEEGETRAHFLQRQETAAHPPHTVSSPRHDSTDVNENSHSISYDGHAKGHAHDPMEDILFLNIGHNGPGRESEEQDSTEGSSMIVSESPPAIDMNIYELAYQDEVDQITDRRQGPSLYLTRRVEHRSDLRQHRGILDSAKANVKDAIETHVPSAARSGLTDIVAQLRAHTAPNDSPDRPADDLLEDALRSDDFPGMPGGFPKTPPLRPSSSDE